MSNTNTIARMIEIASENLVTGILESAGELDNAHIRTGMIQLEQLRQYATQSVDIEAFDAQVKARLNDYS